MCGQVIQYLWASDSSSVRLEISFLSHWLLWELDGTHDLIKKWTSFLEECSKNPALKGLGSKEHDFITESYNMHKERGHHKWEPAETAVLNFWRF